MKSNRDLPDQLRQSCVMLHFQKPFPSDRLGEFYRIQLSQEAKRDGEDEFYMVEMSQPRRAGVKLCTLCGLPMKRVSDVLSRCENQSCKTFTGEPSSRQMVYSGPVRGVVRVLTFPDHVAGDEVKTVKAGRNFNFNTGEYEVVTRRISVQMMNVAVLQLDRRYDDRTLRGVLDAARVVTEELGFKLKE